MIKAAILQTNTPNNVKEANEMLADLALMAKQKGANFITTPEGTNLLERDREKFMQEAPCFDHEGIEFYSDLAKDLQSTLLIGSALFRIGDKALNRSLLFSPEGQLISFYDKIHLFDVNLGEGKEYKESAIYDCGNRAVLADAGFAKIGMSVCYDVRFPHLYRALSQKGAQILTIPAAFTVPTGKAHWEVLLRARAIENSSFVIAPAQAGRHKDGRLTYGHSMIINPWGHIIAHIDNNHMGVAVAEINLEEVDDARQKIPAWQLNQYFENP